MGFVLQTGQKQGLHPLLTPSHSVFQVSDLRSQVYLEDRLDPFPGEGRVVGRQRMRKALDRVEEHPGEANPDYPSPLRGTLSPALVQLPEQCPIWRLKLEAPDESLRAFAPLSPGNCEAGVHL
ncbi:hypothetical protein P7K49_015740 [Saguinus oedipus]|uniref:Uncharacterized protein n=1 Tax=Saguinus oedipus TaxID=9490 RepID=A0ABQ9VA39_SAGOE|nr:hypothetical protein P7K49_015740 [Saguinus oedipus]